MPNGTPFPLRSPRVYHAPISLVYVNAVPTTLVLRQSGSY